MTASCAAQTEAFAAADRARALHHPRGDIDFDTFVRFRLGELVVHGWDIAVAAGIDPELDPDVVHDLWTRVEPHQDEMRAMGGAYGEGAPDLSSPIHRFRRGSCTPSGDDPSRRRRNVRHLGCYGDQPAGRSGECSTSWERSTRTAQTAKRESCFEVGSVLTSGRDPSHSVTKE